MRIFIIRDPNQNNGNRIKFVDKETFIKALEFQLERNCTLNDMDLGYIDEESEKLEIIPLDNHTLRVILDE